MAVTGQEPKAGPACIFAALSYSSHVNKASVIVHVWVNVREFSSALLDKKQRKS